MKKDSYSILEANTTYLVMALVLMTAGAYVQERSFESGIFITEYVFVLLPVLFVGLRGKIDMKKALRLRGIRLKQAVIIVLIAAALIPTVAFANTLTIYLLSLQNKVIVPPIPTASTTGELGLYFFLIAISAGICEEFFFRGMMLNAFEKGINRKWGVIISAVLFGVFHFNMQNLLGPIVLGLMFGYIVQLTDSIFAGVLAHTANNGIAVLAGYLGSVTAENAESMEVTSAQLNDSSALLGSLAVLLVMAAVLWVVILKLLKILRKDTNTFEENSEFRLRGVDYLVVSKYNSSVTAVKREDMTPAELRETFTYTIKELRRLNAVGAEKLWNDSAKAYSVKHMLVPWLGVAAIYLWYVHMHLSYAG